MVPFALFSYAVYEAGCVLRDGCFGPSSSAGLRPGGLGQPQIPVGILVGLAARARSDGLAVFRPLACWRRRLSLTGRALLRQPTHGSCSPCCAGGGIDILIANRPRVIEESLERARTERRHHRRWTGEPGPPSGENGL